MWNKSAEELRAALSAPFQSADIEWRISATNSAKTSGLAVPYVTNRAIQTRLDSTVGIDGWHNDFVPWKGESASCAAFPSIFRPRRRGSPNGTGPMTAILNRSRAASATV